MLMKKYVNNYLISLLIVCLKAQEDDDNVIFLRKWKELGLRYGELSLVMEEVYEEIIALYPKVDWNN